MGFELAVLVWSVLFLLVQITVQALLLNADAGPKFNASPRDEKVELGVMAGRAKRMLANFLETYPGFVALALATAVLDRSGWLTQWGAGLYLAGRIVYVPLYLFGVPYIRSAFWSVASAGLVMMA